MALDEAKVEKIFVDSLKPFIVRLDHVDESLKAITEKFNDLPCDSLSNEIAVLKATTALRVEEFKKEGAKREKDIREAFELIRKDKALKEARLYGIILLIITIGSRFV